MATVFICVAMWQVTLGSNQKYSGTCNYALLDNGNLDMTSLVTGSVLLQLAHLAHFINSALS